MRLRGECGRGGRGRERGRTTLKFGELLDRSSGPEIGTLNDDGGCGEGEAARIRFGLAEPVDIDESESESDPLVSFLYT